LPLDGARLKNATSLALASSLPSLRVSLVVAGMLLYVGVAVFVSRLAEQTGRSEGAWLVYALLLPPIALTHALLKSRRTAAADISYLESLRRMSAASARASAQASGHGSEENELGRLPHAS
jgi:hypothetical protein